MKNIPEWFIGGPLHGQDRRDVFPRDQFGPFRVPPEPGNGDGPLFWYHRQRFTIGNRVIVFWWGYDTSQEVAASMLADLLLAPHEFETERRTEPDNTGDSDRWEDPRDTSGGETDNDVCTCVDFDGPPCFLDGEPGPSIDCPTHGETGKEGEPA